MECKNKICFVAICDSNFFMGALATVNSILEYYPESDIAIIDYNSNLDIGLNEHQKILLTENNNNIKIYDRDFFLKENRVIGAWQYKTYAVNDLLHSNNYDIIIGIDSDCCIVSNLDDIINKCLDDGKIRGGKDGSGKYYDNSYMPYGFETNVKYDKYMSSSLYFIPNNEINKNIMKDTAEFTNCAIYGPQNIKIYPGHGDQGILNAVIYKHTKGNNVDLLENNLWSMHWTCDNSIIVYENDILINKTFNNKEMRSFHSPSMHKIWTKEYKNNINTEWIYAKFLNYVFLGTICLVSNNNINNIIDEKYHHLLIDFINLKDKIEIINKNFKNIWDNLSVNFINIIFKKTNIHRMMPLHISPIKGSMNKYIELVKSLKDNSRVLEVGSYQGGSILTLALSTFHKKHDFHTMESFMGNEDGTVDGWDLPKVENYLHNIKQIFPFLNIKTYKLQSILGSKLFSDEFFDFIFIDGNHSSESVYNDINAWLPKLKNGGILSGDDISWESVSSGIKNAGINIEKECDLWWHIKNV